MTVVRFATVVDPRFLSLTRWASETAYNLAPFATVPQLLDEDDWKDWARYVAGVPALNARQPPRPEAFDKWQQWAVAINQAIELMVLPS